MNNIKCIGCDGCEGCERCDGCHRCVACYECIGCYGCICDGCYACYACCGCSGCDACIYCIFCKDIECSKLKIFNKQVSKSRYDEVVEQWHSFDWQPKQAISSDNSWKDCPKEMLEWIKALPEYDNDIFNSIIL